MFGGHEVTYQAWNGIEDLDMLENNRRFNSAGALYDENGNIVGYHDNEVDDYKQDHAQLHWNQKINTNWSTNLAFHYTRGSGFFEQYKTRGFVFRLWDDINQFRRRSNVKLI